ncbi:MAG TPA: thioredoxin family protein [Nitrososphaeraceae archaeon]|nr:thioredoxin family protein [Nitrososphaeraceae archaeon]
MVKTESSQKLKTGQKAPDFNLLGIDGKLYSLNDFNSKTLLIIFMCNHCPFVKARIKDIVDLQSHFTKDKLLIVGINSNDPQYEEEGFENMKKFSQEYKMNFPYLFDETQKIAKTYGAVCTPDPYLFDGEKRLVFHGKINDASNPDSTPTRDIMKENIEKVLRDEKIVEDFDPSIGCSIKWKA